MSSRRASPVISSSHCCCCFYFGFLIPILKVQFGFPSVPLLGPDHVPPRGHGLARGEELANTQPADIDDVAGFTVLGFALNFAIGCLAYFVLKYITNLRRVKPATVAGYYSSDSAGPLGPPVAVLAGVSIAFNAYMPIFAGRGGDSRLPRSTVPGGAAPAPRSQRIRLHAAEPGYTQPVQSQNPSTHKHLPPPGRILTTQNNTVSSKNSSSRWKSSTFRTRTVPTGVRRWVRQKKMPMFSGHFLQEVFLNIPG